jgi:hypothetical protein
MPAAQRAQIRSFSRAGGYRWNQSAGRYIAPNGRFVSNAEIRRQLDLSLRTSELRIAELTQELRAGSISLDAWHAEMRVAIKDIHVYSGALARGGFAQLTQKDLGRIGQLIRYEYDRLYGFALEISTGAVKLDGRLSDRATQYGEAGRHSYELIRRQVMIEAGMTREWNVLHPADHCEGVGSCIEQTARGKVPIGSLIPVGDRRCLRRCHCTIEYD